MRLSYAVVWSLLAIQGAAAQNDALLAGGGYTEPAPFAVAPGQIVTLFFHGIRPAPSGMLRAGQAVSVPLPTTMAGLSVQVTQAPAAGAYRAAILAVRQQRECDEMLLRPVCLLTAVRVQIPFELGPAIAKLTVFEDGQESRTFLVQPIRDNAHVITSCDLTWDTNPGSVCGRMAFHANGTEVSETDPAQRGETITIYAYGLGITSPRVPTGTASPAGTALLDAVMRQIKVSFVVLLNAAPALPRYPLPGDSNEADTTTFAGLAPGQVGLYQINVRVPVDLPVPIPCGGQTRSNTLVKVSTSQGVENVALCVAP